MSCREQDCVVVLAPYPNNPNPVESFNIKTDFDLTGDGLVWYARPQLFLSCTLCPTGFKASVTPHSVLHRRQPSPHYPIPLKGRSAYWTRLCRHAAGPGQRQQALRGEHLDGSLRPGPPPDGVYRQGGEDQGRTAQREQGQGSRDEEASQRGRCRSGGGARRRRSGLNTGL